MLGPAWVVALACCVSATAFAQIEPGNAVTHAAKPDVVEKPQSGDPKSTHGAAVDDGAAAAAADRADNDNDADWGDDSTSHDANFGLDPGVVQTLQEAPKTTKPWRLSTTYRSDWGLWTERLDNNPFAKGRQSLDLKFDYADKPSGFKMHASVHGMYDFAYLHQRDSYRKPTRDAYEWLIQIRETYVAMEVGAFELTFGRLISAWGEGDILGLLDVVNPRDLREPGQADLEDIRLPVLSTRLGFFHGNHRVEAMMIHEANFGLWSPPLGFYSPFPAFFSKENGFSAEQLGFDPNAMLATKDVYYRHHPERFNINNQQFLARWLYRGSGIDLGVYAASVLQQQGVIVLPTLSPEVLLPQKVYLDMAHPRYTMIGHSGAVPYKAWLLKWELGFDFDKSFNTGDVHVIPPIVEHQRGHLFNFMAGVTYSGLTDTVLTLELQKSTLLKDVPDLLIAVDRPYLAIRGEHRFFRGLFRLSLLGLVLGIRAEQGALIRWNMIYAFRDGMNFSVGYISYLPGRDLGPFAGFNTHDRFLFQYRWDFTAL